jgi:hypothetical protein
MSDVRSEDLGQTPVVKVTVYEHQQVVEVRLCESAEEAAALVASLEENPGVECEIEDLSATTHDEAAFETGAAAAEESYPETLEADDRR